MTDSFEPSDLVLVTGGNGHVASHLIQQLLQDANGPRVRATIRSQSATDSLQNVFATHIASGRLELAHVPDALAPGAFNDAAAGTTHIAHVLSPLVLKVEDVERDLLEPARVGTLAVLKAATEPAAASVRRIVVTSSFAACFNPLQGFPQKGKVYSNKDWSPLTTELAQRAAEASSNGTELPELSRYTGFTAYMASKVLAEKAAWEYYEKAKQESGVKWTLSVVNPTYIGGPNVLQTKKTPEGSFKPLSFSQDLMLKIASGERLADDFPNWIDVRDVAKAHIQALLRDEAQDKRLILTIASGTGHRYMADVIRRVAPQYQPSSDLEPFDGFAIDASESGAALSINKFIPFDTMVRDFLTQTAQA